MPDDPILDGFSDLVERYPGTKTPIEEGRKKRVQQRAQRAAMDDEDEEPEWALNPYFRRSLLLNGKEMTFYTLAALAEALNRRPVTIRAWESQGKFPMTPFRSKEDGAGKRLYTREMIEGAVAIAEEEGLLYVQRPLTNRFTTRVTDLFNDIRKAI